MHVSVSQIKYLKGTAGIYLTAVVDMLGEKLELAVQTARKKVQAIHTNVEQVTFEMFSFIFFIVKLTSKYKSSFSVNFDKSYSNSFCTLGISHIFLIT